jgi:hypothetical protein
LQLCEAHKHCLSCGLELGSQLASTVNPTISHSGFTRHGVKYHVGDYIYVLPECPDVPVGWETAKQFVYKIGCIVKIDLKEEALGVIFMDRYDALPHMPSDLFSIWQVSESDEVSGAQCCHLKLTGTTILASIGCTKSTCSFSCCN